MQQVDLLAYTDNFAKTKDIPSLLRQGDPALCPQPYLSIVIPTYRRAELLKIALDSALSQADAGISYEVVVVDNDPPEEGTPSPTENLLRQYDAPHLLYYRNQENLGIAGNWNRCGELARGQWVAYLHDDDILLPDCLQRLGGLIRKKRDIGGIMALAYELRDDGNLQQAMGKEAGFLRKVYDRLSPKKLMRLRQIDSLMTNANPYGAPTCGSVFRRDFLLASGGFNPEFHPSFDWFFLYRFCSQHKLYRSMERLGYYRVFVNESLSEKTKEAFFRQRVMFVNYASRSTRLGAFLRRLFANEQNHVIINEEYTDFQGKKAEDFFPPAQINPRPVRQRLYPLLTRGYWQAKTYFNLFFG